MSEMQSATVSSRSLHHENVLFDVSDLDTPTIVFGATRCPSDMCSLL